MKILTVNGSPKGEQSACSVMLSALTRGIRHNCEIISINLADKNIQNCIGCYCCWTNNSGCVITDDFVKIVTEADGTDLIVLASPVYFDNISGLLKNFIDRLTSTGNPHTNVKRGTPKFVMVSNCGLASEKEFEVISLWFHRFVSKMQSDILGEYYFPCGKRLKDATDEAALQYLRFLEKKGVDILNALKD